MISGLTVWYWITSWGNYSLLVSAFLYCLSSLLGLGPHEISSFPVSVSLIHVSCRQPCYWEFIPVISRRYNLTGDFMVLWLLQSFHPVICKVPWASGCRRSRLAFTWSLVLCILTSCGLSDFVVVIVSFCLYLLCEERSLCWGTRSTLIYGHKDKCVEYSEKLCWFTKADVIGSPPRSLTSLDPGD